MAWQLKNDLLKKHIHPYTYPSGENPGPYVILLIICGQIIVQQGTTDNISRATYLRVIKKQQFPPSATINKVMEFRAAACNQDRILHGMYR